MAQWLRKPIVIIGIVVVVALIGFFVFQSRSGSTKATSKSTMAKVVRGDLTTVVSGSSSIVAEQNVSLTFQTTGIVSNIAFKEGDAVKKDQVLAVIDTRDLEFQVASAKAAYDSAKAKLDQLISGSGRSSDLVSAQAAVASAQAQLASAREKLDTLNNPTADRISAAKLRVQQAETSLQTTRDNNSATKTKAELDLSKASESLIQAQSKYGVAKYNWDWIDRNNTDPSSGRGPISDASKNTYRDNLVQAESALRTAEQNVQVAQVTYDNAKNAEVANIAQAEGALNDAQIQLNTLLNPTEADIAAAQATVRQSESSLESAKASLDRTMTPGTQTDIAIQQALVIQAESSYNQTKLKLENASLRAPFDGIVSSIDMTVGQTSSGSSIGLINRDPMHIDVKFGETDIVYIKIGQSAKLTMDALPDWQKTGTVTNISPVADNTTGVVSYKVRIDFVDTDPRVLVGMTAIVELITAEKKGVLLIPNSAILPKGSGRIVQVPDTGTKTKDVDITIGLSDGVQTEVLTGLEEGQEIINIPQTATSQQDGSSGDKP